MKDLSSFAKGFGRITLTLLLFRHCKLVRAGLFQVPTSYTVQREKGMIPTREWLIPCPLTLLPPSH